MPRIDTLDLPVVGLDALDGRAGSHHEVLDPLARDHPVVRIEGLGYLLLARRAVDAALRARDTSMPALALLELQGVTEGPVHHYLAGNLLSLSGEEHRAQRRRVSGALGPARAQALRPTMRRHLEDLLEAVTSPEVEFVSAVAKPYPARMIAEIVGAPVSDAGRLGEWAYWIQAALDPLQLAVHLDEIQTAAAGFDVYVREELFTIEPSAATGLLADLLPEVAAGDLDAADAASLISSVLVGGVDTTQAQLAHAVRLFATHPGQWELLVDDPAWIPAAVAEVLRFEPITPFTARLTTAELDLDGITVPQGTLLIACTATANRDPGTYDRPEVFDITADRGDAGHFTFGAGAHFCIGHALARAELEEALSALAHRFAHIELAGEPVFDTPSGVYGLLELPVRLHPRR
ncbi:MAG: cytochrome P450 [Nitriliruptor sp.]|nr:MAG: cytochrome P450 [Nitriliruptor sp.]